MNSLCAGERSLSQNTVVSTGEMPLVVSDKELNENIRLLNKKQREVFDTLDSWSISNMKNLMSQNITAIQPLYLFITGGAGVDKLFLTKSLYQSLTKIFFYRHSSLDKRFILASTGVAVANFDGKTIFFAIYIPIGYFEMNLPGLRDKILKSSLRNKYLELKVLMINEISMVSNDLLFNIHLKLVEICSCQGNKPFANLQKEALHIFAENAPADTLNLAKLEALDSPLHNIPSIDLIPKNLSPKKVEEVLVALKVTLADEQYYCILKQMAE